MATVSESLKHGGVVVLDYGSQYTQLIARRIREQNVFAEVLAPDADMEFIERHSPRAYILSGGPNSVNQEGAPRLPEHLKTTTKPILGICYGMQLLTAEFGGVVGAAAEAEYGRAEVEYDVDNCPLLAGLPKKLVVWMSHGDRLEKLPDGYKSYGTSGNSPYAVMADVAKHRYGVQFHPEVNHSERGTDLLKNFLFTISQCEPCWTTEHFIDTAVAGIKQQVGDKRVLLALSGGVDSAVAGALVHKAIGDQLVSVFVNNGLMRLNEPEQVLEEFRNHRHMNLVYADAEEKFLDALKDCTEPEAKRKKIGHLFIDVFKQEADRLDGIAFLAQGTIYPDVIESAAGSKKARVIKSHHNVGGLPEQLGFALVEPLRDLFKDEVRRIGSALGLPDHIVWRQPFPGPGLAIRCLGDINKERLDTLRHADSIFVGALRDADMLVGDTAQSFAVLLPVKAVGVMGDERTYKEVVVLRAVQTDDFMTADWARLPYDLLAKVSHRIVNEVKGVNRVTMDITSKPPGTIEWE